MKNKKDLLSRTLSSFLFFLILFNVLCLCIPSLESLHSDCASFGHIHMYELQSQQKASHYSVHDEDCHEAKNAAFYASIDFCSCFFKALPTHPGFKLSLKMQNGFISPFLEPRKKPPRANS